MDGLDSIRSSALDGWAQRHHSTYPGPSSAELSREGASDGSWQLTMKRRGAEIEEGRSMITSGSFSKSAPERQMKGRGHVSMSSVQARCECKEGQEDGT